jgi:FkbH-like protein
MESLTFSQLKKNLKKDTSDFKKIKLAVLGNCATQLLSQALRGYAYELRIALDVFDADYDQLEPQTLNPESELFQFEPDYILIQLCSEKLYLEFCDLPPAEQETFADKIIARIQEYWRRIEAKTKAPILQFDFVEFDDSVFGNFGLKTKKSFVYQIRRLNMLFSETAALDKQAFPIALNSLSAQIGRNAFYDPQLFYIAKMPIQVELLPQVVRRVFDTVEALAGHFRKCVVLDLDNTLWGGVVGDDGIEGIRIGELKDGKIYSDLQRYFKELRNRGILLAVCSKNEHAAAIQPFHEHPEMILREDDFVMFVSNWEDKASNIRHIRETLNIGMDSIVFIDDNPFERNAVRSQIADLTVPELPPEPEKYLDFLRKANLFETVSVSGEDAKRTQQYREEAQRTESAATFASYDEYLQSLEMVAEAKPFDLFHFARIAQLTQRSNQFNLRTIRYTESDIKRISEDDHFITLYFTLKDKFGDHGLISVVVLEKRDNGTLFINEFLMSCRVLKRGMEEFIINKIVSTAKENGFTLVEGEYIKTQKNAMVAQLYTQHGFTDCGNGIFHADPNTYIFTPNFIKENRS